jgi:carbohydrate diacid regulator
MSLQIIDSRPAQSLDPTIRFPDGYAAEARPPADGVARNPASFLWQTVLSLSRFNQLAASVCSKLTELLHLPALAVNPHGIIVAASDPAWVGQPLEGIQLGVAPIRAPLALDGETGEILLYSHGAGESISPELALRLTRMVVDQALLIDQFPDRQVLKDKFIYGLLHGHINDVTTIELQATNLGIDLRPPRAVVLVDASYYLRGAWNPERWDPEEAQIDRRVQLVLDRIVDFFSLPNDTICAYMGEGEIALLKASDTKNLTAWAEGQSTPTTSSWANLSALKRAAHGLLQRLSEELNSEFTIGIGRHHPGISGLALSYQDARAALKLGSRFRGVNRIHCLDELGITAFVGISDERTKIDLATHVLRPLDNAPELIETLVSFFENNCSPSETARALELHRNTLTYRLNKIASLTGLDARNFSSAVQIQLALLLRSFHAN